MQGRQRLAAGSFHAVQRRLKLLAHPADGGLKDLKSMAAERGGDRFGEAQRRGVILRTDLVVQLEVKWQQTDLHDFAMLPKSLAALQYNTFSSAFSGVAARIARNCS
ncbi:hypothetical protein SDC9_115964 [bioreactor metagenome]|uniref:Uncharacterized protein n=1 Tax=bioreactor metagenome TaxID=1076179 RepID=A0A645BUA3_9ZZZZ